MLVKTIHTTCPKCGKRKFKKHPLCRRCRENLGIVKH